jgi:hypothetical protein
MMMFDDDDNDNNDNDNNDNDNNDNDNCIRILNKLMSLSLFFN